MGGELYGVAREVDLEGRGTLFRVSSSGVRTAFLSFNGTTSAGGDQDTGAVIRVNPSNNEWNTVESSPATAGTPEWELPAASDGSILGFTTSG